jgi:hypothetical protein
MGFATIGIGTEFCDHLALNTFHKAFNLVPVVVGYTRAIGTVGAII